MSDLADKTSRAFDGLSALAAVLDTLPDAAIAVSDVSDQLGQLRVWTRNLGVLAPGPASLDHRLRDAPTMYQNVAKLLLELSENVSSMSDILRGKRIPFDQQPPPASDTDDASSISSAATSSSSDVAGPMSELELRFQEVDNIITHLFKLSVKIRGPGSPSRHLKAASHRQIDPDTGSDIFDSFRWFDSKYVADAVYELRKEVGTGDLPGAWLIERLAAAITLRRKKLAYWQRHRRKLAANSAQPASRRVAFDSPMVVGTGPLAAFSSGAKDALLKAPSQRPSEKSHTIFSATEATMYLDAKPDHDDTGSELSAASTALDSKGRKAAIPPPPKNQLDRELECSLCFATCPPQYAKEKVWRSHVFHDLEPYVCTIETCADGEKTYASRRAWLEHEKRAHRAVWRCPTHPSEVFHSRESLEGHLNVKHVEKMSATQLEKLMSIAVAWEDDQRTECPICDIPATASNGLHNHIASHMERFAVFALPMGHFSTQNEQVGSNESHDARMSRSSESNYSGSGKISWHSRSNASSAGSLPEIDVGPMQTAPTAIAHPSQPADRSAEDIEYGHEPVSSLRDASVRVSGSPTNSFQQTTDKPSSQFSLDDYTVDFIDETTYLSDPHGFNKSLRSYLQATEYLDLTPTVCQMEDLPVEKWSSNPAVFVESFNALIELLRANDRKIDDVRARRNVTSAEMTPTPGDTTGSRKASKDGDPVIFRDHMLEFKDDHDNFHDHMQDFHDHMEDFHGRMQSFHNNHDNFPGHRDNFHDRTRHVSNAHITPHRARRKIRFEDVEESGGSESGDQSKSDRSTQARQPHKQVRMKSPERPVGPEKEENSTAEDDFEANEPGRSILKRPTSKFPEFPDPELKREGVLKSKPQGAPPGARWTKINRSLVNPQALEEHKERFEEREDCVIVLRVLTKEDIQTLADRTKEIRDQRNQEKPSAEAEGQASPTAASSENLFLKPESPVPSNRRYAIPPEAESTVEVLPPSDDADELWEYIRSTRAGRDHPVSTTAPSDSHSRRSSIRSSVGERSGTETPLTEISRSAAGSEYEEKDDLSNASNEDDAADSLGETDTGDPSAKVEQDNEAVRRRTRLAEAIEWSPLELEKLENKVAERIRDGTTLARSQQWREWVESIDQYKRGRRPEELDHLPFPPEALSQDSPDTYLEWQTALTGSFGLKLTSIRRFHVFFGIEWLSLALLRWIEPFVEADSRNFVRSIHPMQSKRDVLRNLEAFEIWWGPIEKCLMENVSCKDIEIATLRHFGLEWTLNAVIWDEVFIFDGFSDTEWGTLFEHTATMRTMRQDLVGKASLYGEPARVLELRKQVDALTPLTTSASFSRRAVSVIILLISELAGEGGSLFEEAIWRLISILDLLQEDDPGYSSQHRAEALALHEQACDHALGAVVHVYTQRMARHEECLDLLNWLAWRTTSRGAKQRPSSEGGNSVERETPFLPHINQYIHAIESGL